MALSVEQFLKHITASELVPADDMQSLLAALAQSAAADCATHAGNAVKDSGAA